jgi:hypothetical protein
MYVFLKNCWILIKLPTKYFINSQVLKNVTSITLKVELGMVSLDAALNTKTIFTLRTPKYHLSTLALFTAHHTPLCFLGSPFSRWNSFRKLPFSKAWHFPFNNESLDQI